MKKKHILVASFVALLIISFIGFKLDWVKLIVSYNGEDAQAGFLIYINAAITALSLLNLANNKAVKMTGSILCLLASLISMSFICIALLNWIEYLATIRIGFYLMMLSGIGFITASILGIVQAAKFRK